MDWRRDDNFTRGFGYPSGMGSGTKFDPWVLPVPDTILLRVGYGFNFLPAGTRRISENSNFRFSTYQYIS
jgi:hypothetical protein